MLSIGDILVMLNKIDIDIILTEMISCLLGLIFALFLNVNHTPILNILWLYLSLSRVETPSVRNIQIFWLIVATGMEVYELPNFYLENVWIWICCGWGRFNSIHLLVQQKFIKNILYTRLCAFIWLPYSYLPSN